MRKEKKYHYIYKTTNNLSGRYYYGMHSSDVLEDGYLGSGTYLRLAIKKHGKENFTREIIEFCKTRKELKSRESQTVTLQEVANKECMNLRVGGSGEDYKSPITTETRKKMSESAMGNTSAVGYNHTEETRKKISEKGKGRFASEETRKKMSETHMGRIVSEETRKKISESNIGNFHTEESKLKMSKSHKGQISSMFGKSHTEESKQKMSKSAMGNTNALGYSHSEEAKLKMRVPQKQITCPHCNKIGGISNMTRYHFDNCKNQYL